MPDMLDTKEVVESRILTGLIEHREETKGDEKKRYLQGYAARFNTITDLYWFDEEILPGAFAESIGKDDIRALINHDPNIVLGRNRANTLELKEDSAGLYSIIDPPATQWGEDTITSVKRGDISQMSFQFIVLEEKWISSEERESDHELRQIMKAKLRDVSIVTFPAYEITDVSYRSEARSAEFIFRSRCMRRSQQLNHYLARYLQGIAQYN